MIHQCFNLLSDSATTYPSTLLKPGEAAAYLGMNQAQLKWRVDCYGIPYVKLKNSIRYRRLDLDAYKKKYMSILPGALLTGEKAAKYCGISLVSLCQAARDGRIRYFKLRCKRFYRIEDLDAYPHRKNDPRPGLKVRLAYITLCKKLGALPSFPVKMKESKMKESIQVLCEQSEQIGEAYSKLDAALKEWKAAQLLPPPASGLPEVDGEKIVE